MHAEARMFLESKAPLWTQAERVLDVGGRDVNGTPRDLFPLATTYTIVDAMEGDGVDVVMDASSQIDWPFEERFDVAISTETFEHARRWDLIVANMARSLKVGGLIVVTAASDPRPVHSGVDGFELRDDEWYENVDPGELQTCLLLHFDNVRITTHPRGDVYAVAERL